MARKQRAEQWAKHRRQRDEEERQCRVMVDAAPLVMLSFRAKYSTGQQRPNPIQNEFRV
jgi:hypothetical protein